MISAVIYKVSSLLLSIVGTVIAEKSNCLSQIYLEKMYNAYSVINGIALITDILSLFIILIGIILIINKNNKPKKNQDSYEDIKFFGKIFIIFITIISFGIYMYSFALAHMGIDPLTCSIYRIIILRMFIEAIIFAILGFSLVVTICITMTMYDIIRDFYCEIIDAR